jgi:hypothetical protein
MNRWFLLGFIVAACGEIASDDLPRPDAEAGSGGADAGADAASETIPCAPTGSNSCKVGHACCADLVTGQGYCCQANHCDGTDCWCGDGPGGYPDEPGCRYGVACCPLGPKYYGTFCVKAKETPDFSVDHCYFPRGGP